MDLVPRPSDRLGISRVRVQNTSILAVIIQCIACDTSVSHVLPNKFGLLGRAERRSTRRSGQPAPSVPCVKFQRRAAHAVTLAIAVATAAVEDVAEVRAAAGAADLCAHHPVRFVVEQLDGFRRDRLGEARPGGVVLRLAVEELVAAGATSESDLSSVAPWPAEELETASVARGDPLVTRAKMRAVVYEPSPHSPRQRSTARDPTSPSARRGSGRRWRPSRRIGRA